MAKMSIWERLEQAKQQATVQPQQRQAEEAKQQTDLLNSSNSLPMKIKTTEGTIKQLTDKGYGFIKVGDEKDLIFHSSSVQGGNFDDLHEGQKVSFTEGTGPNGPCAENVKPV